MPGLASQWSVRLEWNSFPVPLTGFSTVEIVKVECIAAQRGEGRSSSRGPILATHEVREVHYRASVAPRGLSPRRLIDPKGECHGTRSSLALGRPADVDPYPLSSRRRTIGTATRSGSIAEGCVVHSAPRRRGPRVVTAECFEGHPQRPFVTTSLVRACLELPPRSSYLVQEGIQPSFR